MPPKVSLPPLPTGLGQDAHDYLAHMGIVATSPPIRGSNWNHVCSDPFSFYLRVRLGLRKAINESKALSAGSWGHTAAELHDDLDTFNKLVDKNVKSMRETAQAINMNSTKIASAIADERRYAACGFSWWQIVAAMPLANGRTINDFFKRDNPVHIISQEDKIRIPGKAFNCMSDIVIQPDAIAVNRTAKKIWIIDWKSTSFPTVDRLSLCPLEFATQLYSHVLNHLIEEGTVGQYVHALSHEEFKDYTFGGMIHVAYQKPSFKFGTNEDRPYRWVSNGKRKKIWGTIILNSDKKFATKTMGTDRTWKYGEPFDDEMLCVEHLNTLTGKKPSKEYDGEPSVELYIKRCAEWYHGTGIHTDLVEERRRNPIVNMSFVPYKQLQKEADLYDFNARLNIIDHYSLVPPLPRNFPKHGNPTGYQTKPSHSSHFPFYVTEAAHWPAIIVDKQLIQSHRD